MQNRHSNRLQYFKEQTYTTKKYVIPYIQKKKEIEKNITVLEIGCGEGGNLSPFLNLGCTITGIDLSKNKIDKAKEFYKDHPNNANIFFICNDIYKQSNLGKFDIILLRDVIEHIPNQEKFMGFMSHFLKNDSIIYFGFPPWQNPFGGHQQVCRNKYLSKLPYFHLLPYSIYKWILRMGKEGQGTIQSLIEIKNTGISIERFEKALKHNNYQIEDRTLYFINPNYEVKFKLKPRKQNKIIANIPWFRNFFTTAAYYLVSNKNVQ